MQNIKGEIIEVNEDIMKWLDEFEDCPDLYYRHTITVLSNNGPVECICYFLVNHKKKLLELPYLDDYDSYGAHGKQYLMDVDDEWEQYDEIQNKG